MFWELLLITSIVWIINYRWQWRRLYKIADEFPSGVKSYPIIGHAYLFIGDDEDRMKVFQLTGRKAIENGGISSGWMMNLLYLSVADPVAADAIFKTCLEKSDQTLRYMPTVFGNGSIFAPVNIWRPRRKILAPIFSMKNLNQFVAVFDKQSTIMAKLLAPMAGAGDFSIWKHITTYTFDSVGETTLDVKFNAQTKPIHPFLTSMEVLLKLVAHRSCSPWMFPDFIYERLACYKEFIAARQLVWDFVDELIQKKRKLLETLEKEGKASSATSFLDMMIQQSGKGNKEYSDLELREEAFVIILAGTDTSAVGSAFTTVLLSRYPDIQEKVYQELQDVFGNSDRPLTVKDLPNLKYLEVVIKESLRLYPPVPITTRKVESDVELPTGSTLVNGTGIIVHIWAMHRNPKYWGEDAELFRPERFLETPLVHPAQFQPFSFGMRNCLGLNYAMMSMKTVLANLLRRYKVLPPRDMDPVKMKEPLRVKYDIMMKHVDDYVVRLVKRD